MKGRMVLAVSVVVGLLASACAASASTAPYRQDVPMQAELRWSGSYEQDIQPIFDAYCVTCHGKLQPENALRLDSYEGVMAGTRFGPVVVPGSAGGSTLVYVLQGGAPYQVSMPHNGLKLTPNRMQNIVLWINAGAPRE